MSPLARTRPALLSIVIALVGLVGLGRARAVTSLGVQTPVEGPKAFSPDTRAATFTFAPGTAPADQQLFLQAVAGARPEARRLIEVIDGATEVSFGGTGGGALGVASARGLDYKVRIDLGATLADAGRRGVPRVVLHELGHVVDYGLLPDATVAALDRQIPAGYPCPQGQPISSCAPTEERFAETFAKWATGDIGAALYVGYAVPPPSVTLDVWGQPLAQLPLS